VYPERVNDVGLPLQTPELWAQCKARWVLAGAVAKYSFGHVRIAVRQGRQRRGGVAAGKEQLGRCAAGQGKYYWLYVGSSKLVFAAMCLRRVRVVGRRFAVGAPPRTHVSTALRLRHKP
jgi:hypothetical protein